MKNTTLSVTFNADKLDALAFHMEKKDAHLQKELTETIQKLYEKYVPQTTREYIDDKVVREVLAKGAKDRARKPDAPIPPDSQALDS